MTFLKSLKLLCSKQKPQMWHGSLAKVKSIAFMSVWIRTISP
ncbi:Uncharacterised protein [Vibrio cholerae]|nr:Uncharacterised protein [Vibrio cholerae]